MPQVPAKSGQLVIWYDQNFIPPLQSVHIPLYLPSINQSTNFTFPIYKEVSLPSTALQVSVASNGQAQITTLPATQAITNVYGLAARQLQEEYPMIFLRQALRIALQAGIATPKENESVNNQLFADLSASVMNIMSSFADLRSWLSLPDNTQIGSYALAPQTYALNLQNGNQITHLQVPISSGKTTLVWVTQYGKELNANILFFSGS